MRLNEKELTIGHRYYYDNNMMVFPKKLTIKDFQIFDKYPERYSGIPLTSKILTENLGFEVYLKSKKHKRKANKYAVRVSSSRVIKKQGYLVLSRIKGGFLVDNFGNKTVTITTVHGMQDFWFALTSKGLEFKD